MATRRKRIGTRRKRIGTRRKRIGGHFKQLAHTTMRAINSGTRKSFPTVRGFTNRLMSYSRPQPQPVVETASENGYDEARAILNSVALMSTFIRPTHGEKYYLQIPGKGEQLYIYEYENPNSKWKGRGYFNLVVNPIPTIGTTEYYVWIAQSISFDEVYVNKDINMFYEDHRPFNKYQEGIPAEALLSGNPSHHANWRQSS